MTDANQTGSFDDEGMFDLTVDAAVPGSATQIDVTPASVEPQPKLLANPIVLGPYTLTKRLGAGGMAEVFYAEKAEGDDVRPMVIKRMLPHLALQPKYVEMFKREAEVAARLRHPHIVHIEELAHIDDTYVIAMEFVDGLTLFQLAQRAWRAGRSVPIELVLYAMVDTAEALHYAYTVTPSGSGPLRLIHRDISPDNLMIDKDGHTKILDFGIAKAADSRNVTKTGEMKGKIPFMSPEQLAGRALSHQSDLYALGVVLFWMLTGRRPFRGESDLLLMQAIVRDPAPRPSELNPEVPKALDVWALNLMAKRPDLRPLDGAFVAEELAKMLVGGREKVAAFVRETMALPANATPHPSDAPRARGFDGSDLTVWNRQPTRLYSRARLLMLDDIRERARAEDALAVAPQSEASDATRIQLAEARRRQSVMPAVLVGLLLAAMAGFLFLYLEVYGTDDGEVPPPIEIAAPPPPDEPPAAADPPAAAPPDEPPAAADAPAKAEADPPDEPARKAPRTKHRRDRTRKIDVKVVGDGMRWTLPSKSRLKPDGGKVSVSSSTKWLYAVDRRTGGRSRVPIKNGVADASALQKGKLAVRVFPYAEVKVGRRPLGSTPFPPVSLVEGTYWLTFTHDDKTVTKEAVVRPGDTTVLKVDMRDP